MPALRLAQERYGWLSPDALREVADALDLTPAYCKSVASFYDMYHLEPVGRHVVEVCTNLACALAGAQRVVEAFESELGVRLARRRRTARSRSARSNAPAAAAMPRSSSSTAATASPSSPRTSRRSWRRSVPRADVLLAHRRARPDAARRVPRRRRLRRARKGEGMDSDALIDELVTSTLRGRGGAGFPTGRKASLVDRSGAPADVPRRQRRRVGAGRFQGPRDHGARPAPLIEGCLIAARAIALEARLHLHPRRVPRGVRGAAACGRRRARRGPVRRRRRSPSTAARAPTSAARRRRCSTRSRAGAASRGRGRRSRRSRASTCRRRRSTTCRRSRRSRAIIDDGRRRVREDRRPTARRAPRSSRCRATS